KMDEAYKDKKKWAQMSLVNISKAGIFSADRSIREYAQNIWNIKPIK
nr:glycogen/starch/alpha-glucan phosphorylase [bacterium]